MKTTKFAIDSSKYIHISLYYISLICNKTISNKLKSNPKNTKANR